MRPGKVYRKKQTFAIERVKKATKQGKASKNQGGVIDVDKPRWRELAGTSVFNTQTESIIIDQVHCQIPGNSRWDGDDVVNIDGQESDVDELKLSGCMSSMDKDSPEQKIYMSKAMSRTLSNIALASHKSPSSHSSTDMYHLQIPRSIQTKTNTDDHSTEDNNRERASCRAPAC